MAIIEAAIEGARTRFRAVMMTSFAFIAGLIPLVTADGRGDALAAAPSAPASPAACSPRRCRHLPDPGALRRLPAPASG